MAVTESPTDTPPDGRSLRRDRNREAVVEALLSLYREGVLEPSTDAIAERAGISARSLFRYFDDSEAMVHTAIARQQAHLLPLYDLSAEPAQPLDERIDRFVADRVRLVEEMGNVGRVARSVALRQPAVAAELTRIRSVLRGQLDEVFGDELRARPDVRAALDVLLSWESVDLLRNDHGLSHDDAVSTIRSTMRKLL